MTKTLSQPPDGFTCGVCGEYHKGLPLDIAFGAPIYWNQIPEPERNARGELTPDFCAIDDRDFFVRGLIEIPIHDSDQFFMWGVWTSLSLKNYSRVIDLWRDPKIVDEPPYFGWLANKFLYEKAHIDAGLGARQCPYSGLLRLVRPMVWHPGL